MAFSPVVHCGKYNVTIYQLKQVTELQLVPSDCKGWNITDFEQHIVLKVPVFGAHPQSEFLDSL